VIPLTLDTIRDCLEGATPGILATCSTDGTPNVSYLSQIHYVDREHVALSFQFFNKTRANVLANPQARLQLIHPASAAMYRLQVRYLRTETEGPLFESMKAKLAGIASHTGMAGVFRLLGSDVYRVQAIEQVHTGNPGAILVRPNLLAALRACAQRLARHAELDALLGELLASLDEVFAIRHAMVLMLDPAGRHLYTVATRGYDASGVGSEVPLGAGVIGVAARERTPIRITHMTAEYAYGRAIRDRALADGLAAMLETEIPLPGLARPGSQLAVPIVAPGERLVGVLFVESPEDLRFTYDDEDALVALAAQVGSMLQAMQCAAEAGIVDAGPAEGGALSRGAGPAGAGSGGAGPGGATRPDLAAGQPSDAMTVHADGRSAVPGAAAVPLRVRHYRADHSVFLDDEYLIKGVAGAILWALLNDHAASGRVAFSNRELRLDPRIRLPDVSDNLEARLVLLQRRLAERDACLRLERAGRGRLRLVVGRPLELQEAG